MKIPHLFTGIIALALFLPPGSADESSKTASLSHTQRAVPFSKFWDSRSWDKSGAVPFWHKQREKRVSPVPNPKKNSKSAEKETRTSPKKAASNP